MDTVVDALKDGDKVALVGFGTFDVRERAARTGLKSKNHKNQLKLLLQKLQHLKQERHLKTN